MSAELLPYLKAIAAVNPPNYQQSIDKYRTFDWAKIGATPIKTDAHGVTHVAWCGHVYTRRAGSNAKYGAAIWYSRSIGKGEGDQVAYVRLITFKAGGYAAADPLPDYVLKAIR